MPLFRFKCYNCETVAEYLVRGSALPKCKKCEGSQLEKLITLPASNKREFFGIADNISGFSNFENQVIEQAKKDVKPHIDAGG